MRKLKIISMFLFLLSFLIGCSKDPLPEIRTEASAVTQKVNSFVKLVMNDVYLWYKDVPDLDIRYELDSEDYFYKLLNNEDKWSFITDDLKSLESSFEGVETAFGYSLAFGEFSNTGNIFAVVEYVYPNTPASEAGIARGDIIVEMSGNDITKDNYTDLLNAANLNLSFGILGAGGISIDPKTVNIVAKELNLNPVLISNVVEHGKIGRAHV